MFTTSNYVHLKRHHENGQLGYIWTCLIGCHCVDVISFVSPYCIESLKDADHIYVLDRFYLGLLAECVEKYCDWFLNNHFIVFEYLPGIGIHYAYVYN